MDKLQERLRAYRGGTTEWRDLMDEALAEITRLKGEVEEAQSTLAYLWKWVERGLFDPQILPADALAVLSNYPGAPWKHGRWDVDHKPYAEQFYERFPKARSSGKAGSECGGEEMSGNDIALPSIALSEPTLEEATMAAIMKATNATFNWRGQEDLTPLMAVNICAGVVAYLRAMPPGYSLEELAVAIESLKIALGSKQP